MLDEHRWPIRTEPLPAPQQVDGDRLQDLRELLLGQRVGAQELPALPDLVAAVSALASGTRRKVLLALRDTPIELALVRRGASVVVDCYTTDSAPELLMHEREIALRDLIETCAALSTRTAEITKDHASAEAIEQLGRRLRKHAIRPDAHTPLQAVRCTGGSLDSPGEGIPLAFGFAAEIMPSVDPAPESHAFADVHALLFPGTLWAFAGGRRLTVLEGPIGLAAQRMVAAVRALCEAWQADRNVHVRLRSAGFWVAVRRERGGTVSLTLSGNGRGEALTWPALSVRDAALPILRLASDLIRKLVTADRRQSHNLRLSALRAEIRSLRTIIRARERLQSFENRDPERLRLSSPELDTIKTEVVAAPTPQPSALRYSRRWSVEIDGLDASSVFLCGDRLIVAAQKLTLALSRSSGEVLWSQPTGGASTLLAGRTLLRQLPDGELSLHDIEDGQSFAQTRLSTRGRGLYVTSTSFPPMVILADANQQLSAIDLRTGQPRWRFRAHGQAPLQLARSGRVLCVTSGDGTVDALDLATGEVVWRFGERVRFCLKPAVCGDVVVALSGEPRGGAGAAFGIDLYSGKRLWQRELPSAPSADPIDAGACAIVPYGRSRQAKLLALDPMTGAVHWREADPGLDNGGQAITVDGALIINTPSGRVLALDVKTGATRWTRSLSNPLTDDVPRQLEPLLRQGALFVPSAQVHVLRLHDGNPLGQPECDLVPDCLRVDERGWFYVAEESGHLCAFGAAPHLSLVR